MSIDKTLLDGMTSAYTLENFELLEDYLAFFRSLEVRNLFFTS